MSKKYVTDSGGNGKVVVLLHGFLASSSYWSKVKKELVAADYRVMTIDLLGFGKAPKPRGINYNYDDHIAYLRQVITDLPIDKKIILIGHSMGALLALRYALTFSDQIESLVLLHPPMYRDKDEVRHVLRGTGAAYRFLLDSRFRHIVWKIVSQTSPFSHHNRESRDGSLRNVIERAEFFTDITHITLPTLLVVGLKDRSVYRRNLSNFPLPDRVEVVIENVTHHSPRRNTRVVTAKILEYLSTTV